ncbi:MAG: DNA/RNA non-specific endonuclease [Flavonifractor plautii]
MRRVFPLLLLLALLLAGCQGEAAPAVRYDLDQVPAYAGEPYVVINDNQPFFGEEEYTTEAFETYSALDGLGRCGTAYACVGRGADACRERESISSVAPPAGSTWSTMVIPYNRCHLIGFQLTGENANERNLITGTRYMNVEGMLPLKTWWPTM